MKFVWPPITQILRERQAALAEGLEKAAAAEKQLEEANNVAEAELDDAKKQSAELIAQARNRASQIVEEAKTTAQEEADRIKVGAQAEIDQEINQARDRFDLKSVFLQLKALRKSWKAASIDRLMNKCCRKSPHDCKFDKHPLFNYVNNGRAEEVG